MKAKIFSVFTACCLLAMAGCSDGKVQSTVSRIEDDVSNAVSRVESALDPDGDASDGFPDEDEISSMPDYSSSQGGGINSGDRDIVNGTESDIGSHIDDESRLESRADEDDSEASKDTKDM